VKRCFLDYREAIGKPDGERAASLAAAATLDYFEFTRRAALSMPEPELRKRGLVDRLQIQHRKVLNHQHIHRASWKPPAQRPAQSTCRAR
jgi:hypothetical protein